MSAEKRDMKPAEEDHSTADERTGVTEDDQMLSENEAMVQESENENVRRFRQRWNFDPVDGRPLPGRYEWERVTPPEAHNPPSTMDNAPAAQGQMQPSDTKEEIPEGDPSTSKPHENHSKGDK